MKRRDFLKLSASTLAAASLGGLTTALTSLSANAANTSGYKALVCLFLYGGMDNHDTIIPYDSKSYNRWAQIRASLVNAQGANRQRNNLLPLSPLNASDYGSRQFALPPEFSGIHKLFQTGNAAIVGNVGPIIKPMTANQFSEESVPLPPRLFSHNDQQAIWMSGSPEGSQYGWGGKFSDAVLSAGANPKATFSTITTGGSDVFITGRQTTPYQIIGGNALQWDILGYDDEQGGLSEALTKHIRAEQYRGNSLLAKDVANKFRASFDANRQYDQAVQSGTSISTSFPSSSVGSQLQSVARSIAIRDKLQTNRQIFVVEMGGFDTHSTQANDLPKLQQQIDEAVVAFHNSMIELGLSNDVTLFTASDFGRTLAINGDGTDHGWGGHHFVVGGAVQGQTIYGDIPVADFGHPLDAGSGRLIPTTSIEQYAAPMGRWFGLSDTDILSTFPNLTNFAGEPRLFA